MTKRREPPFSNSRETNPDHVTCARSFTLSDMVRDPDLRTDVALANLVCANGLPGAADLPISRYLDWLDEAAAKVRLLTHRNYHKFLDSPSSFDNSQARFCIICMVTVLQQECGVRYQGNRI